MHKAHTAPWMTLCCLACPASTPKESTAMPPAPAAALWIDSMPMRQREMRTKKERS